MSNKINHSKMKMTFGPGRVHKEWDCDCYHNHMMCFHVHVKTQTRTLEIHRTAQHHLLVLTWLCTLAYTEATIWLSHLLQVFAREPTAKPTHLSEMAPSFSHLWELVCLCSSERTGPGYSVSTLKLPLYPCWVPFLSASWINLILFY